MDSESPTMQHILLAQQYDPLGIIITCMAWAMVLIQRLLSKRRSWNEPNLPPDILEAWSSWEEELPELANISIP